MRPELRYAQQLEEMPVKPEYRAAVAAGIAALRRLPPRQLREERMRGEREEAFERVILLNNRNELALHREIAALRELVHPSGTWVAGSPRRKKLKSLYCSLLGRWRTYRDTLIQLARGDEGFRWYPDNDQSARMKQAARALFDAAMEIAKELDEREKP